MPVKGSFHFASFQDGPTERDRSDQIADIAKRLTEAERLWNSLGRTLSTDAHRDNIMSAVNLCSDLRTYINDNARTEVRKEADKLRQKLAQMLTEANSAHASTGA